jgi:hypothetical protein
MIEFHDSAGEVNFNVLGSLRGWGMTATIGRPEHASREFLSSCITYLVESIIVEEELIEDLITVLLIHVPTLILSSLVLNSQPECVLAMLIIDDLVFRCNDH